MNSNEPKTDAQQLANLGHAQSFERRFSRWSMLGLAFAILNSWTALAASLSLALPSGGPVAVIWGLITAGVCNICLAASLAELLSAYPTAGGQYHWIAMIVSPRWRRSLAWMTGWINLSGWVALVATNALLSSQLVINILALELHHYAAPRWHQFLIYCAITFIAFLLNAFAYRILPHINKFAFAWSIVGFIVISITVLACAAPNFASPHYVFQTFLNSSGWPNGVAWLLGLLQGGLGLTGFDAVAHMVCEHVQSCGLHMLTTEKIEEIPNASIEGPRIMIYCVCIGVFTGFLFLCVLLFVSGGASNADTVVHSARGPLLEIFYTATASKVGATCLLIFPLLCLVFAAVAVMTTSSRMTFAFARDGGLPYSRLLWKIHPTLNVPLNALYMNVVVVVVFGCIFLGSTTAFNAITAASVVALGVSYAIPILAYLVQGRPPLPGSKFHLSPLVGCTANIIGIIYTVVTTVLFLFPPTVSVDGSTMNYCILAFGIILLISVVQWYLDGRKNFRGPSSTIRFT